MKILFLSYKHRYLCNPIFLKIAKASPELHHIYLECDDQAQVVYLEDKSSDEEAIKSVFDEYHFLPPIKKTSRTEASFVPRIWSNLKAIKQWKKELNRTLDLLRPDVVVSISDISLNHQLCVQKLGPEKIIFLQHGPITKYLRPLSVLERLTYHISKLLLGVPIGRKQSIAANENNKINYLFWSEAWTEHFKDKKKITYVGPPIYDELLAGDIATGSSISPLQNLPRDGKPVVSIFLNKSSNIGVPAWEAYASVYQDLIKNLDQFYFLVKTHPQLQDSLVLEYFADGSLPNLILVRDATAYEVLLESDVMITHWSTVLYEALSLKIPTLLYNLEGKYDYSKLRLENYPFVLDQEEELINHIKACLEKTSREAYIEAGRNFLEKQIGPLDGKSAERVVKYIKSFSPKAASPVFQD